MDIGEAFLSKQARTIRSAAGNLLPYSLAEFRPPAIDGSGSVLAFRLSPDAQRIPGPTALRFLLGLQNLAALVHAGLQIEVVGTAQFTGILILDIGWLLQSICRAAHATPRGRCFSSRNGHVGVL